MPARDGGCWRSTLTSNPNLALTLGLSAERMRAISPLMPDLLRRTPAGALTPHLTRSLEEIEASHAVTGADGVEPLVMALPQQADTGCLSHLRATVLRALLELGEARELDARGVEAGMGDLEQDAAVALGRCGADHGPNCR